MTLKPQQMLVEERGLENQIKRLKDLIPEYKNLNKSDFYFTAKYLREQLTTIVQDLEDIKTGIKYENDRIMKDQLINNNKQLSFNFK